MTQHQHRPRPDGRVDPWDAVVATPESDEIRYTRWVSQLQANLAESVGGILLRGARVVQLGAATDALSRIPGPAALVGCALRNTDTANPATVLLLDGVDSTGALVVPVELAAGASWSAWYGPGGLNLSRGLFAAITGGPVDGAAYLRGDS